MHERQWAMGFAGKIRWVRIRISDDGCGAVEIRLDGRLVCWRVSDKRLADVASGRWVCRDAMFRVLYDVLTPGRRAWLTRWNQG